MLDRRSILKLLPTAMPLWAAEPTVHEIKDNRTLIVFRLTRQLPKEHLEHFADNARKTLERAGLKGVPAWILPYGVEMDVFSLPPGGVQCSESDQSKCVSSAASR